MASDLSSAPTSGLTVQLCGDAHLANFGLFQAPDRRLVFDINDFDETLPGPWEWDVKRLAASFEVAGRERRFGAAIRHSIVMMCVHTYRESMMSMAESRAIDVWYMRLDASRIRDSLEKLSSASAKKVKQDLAGDAGRNHLRAFARLTETVDGHPRFRSDPPVLVPAAELLTDEERENYQSVVEVALASYRSSLPPERRYLYDVYRFQDIARKVVGVGSVGMRAWVLLFTGRDADDPLFLQAKQAQTSVLERFVGRSRYHNAGRRVVEGQKLMQSTSDILLGWYHVLGFDGKPYDFYVRELWDGKGSFSVQELDESAWHGYARMCAWVLARAHARTGDRIAIASYLGGGDVFDAAIAEFAAAYADQNQRDFDAFADAAANGRIQAITGV